jgi:hypothetical protein
MDGQSIVQFLIGKVNESERDKFMHNDYMRELQSKCNKETKECVQKYDEDLDIVSIFINHNYNAAI